MRRLGLAVVLALTACTVENRANAPKGEEPEVFADRMRAGGAFFNVRPGPEGAVFITLPKVRDDGVALRLIYSAGLTAGLGSNPVGLDRGYGDEGRIIIFRRIGDKVIIEAENLGYRASADNRLEKNAVAQSFARSFLWAGKVGKENVAGTFDVDIASFLTADPLNLVGILEAGGQGGYAIDKDRSFVDPDSVLVFPDNVEIDAFVTLAASKAGSEVAATAADGRVFTLTQHHSFVRLPDDGFKTRAFDQRAGAIDVPYYDFSARLDEPVVKRLARRFRLERKNPSAPTGPVKKPIVFYIDPGAPEPIRQALVDGAKWWEAAFEAAGFEGAYRVELLPADAHPMDVRYNVVQWVHRQTRGWSYGGGVYDPRTGEMLKAHVVLGSQRVRQDRMIFEGLAGADKTGSGGADDPIELSLARIRQLSAHEIGHTLGFAHNFAASSNDRASVMDYPAPYVRPTEAGGLDFSGAYTKGIGEWDKVATRWLYSEYPARTDVNAALDKIMTDAYGRGLRFVDDAQARGVDGAQPYGAVWDNGGDPVAALDETMRVRAIALAGFGERVIKPGRPRSDLNAVLAPIYLYHRYQIDAAAKLIGGYEFRYAMRGDKAPPAAIVDPARQRAALAVLVATLDPAALDLPDATLDLLTPDMESFDGRVGGAELFASDTGPMFDLLSAADAAGSKTLAAILHPARAARLIEMERRRVDALTYGETLSTIERALFWAEAEASDTARARKAEIARRLQARYVSMLIEIASGGAASGEAQSPSLFLDFGPGEQAAPQVKLRTNAYLKGLRDRLAATPFGDFGADRQWRDGLRDMIDAHLRRPAPALTATTRSVRVPPGSPIGGGMGISGAAMTEDCWFCEPVE